MPTVVSLGSINVDHIRRVDADALATLRDRYEWFPEAGETRPVDDVPEEIRDGADQTRLGGKGANQAVAAGRAGADAALFGLVGEDEAEFGVLETLAEDVDIGGVEPVDAPTGAAYIFVESDGENRIALLAGANAHVDTAYVNRHVDAIADADCLLLQNEIPVAAMTFLLAALADVPDRPTVVVDPAPVEGTTALLAQPTVDYITPNEGEYAALAAAGALDSFHGTVVQTRGEADIVVEEHRTEQFRVTPPAADVVDTTGAGDTFNGYFATRLAAGDSIRRAIEVAAAASARAVEREGAQPSIPTADEVDAALN